MLRELGIKYIALNPGASYRGFHDSLVNFESAEGPQMIMCTHEEIAVAIANGYARATGEIMATGLARYRRFAAREHGDLQRLVRPHADPQSRRRRAAGHHQPALDGLGAHGERAGFGGARVCEIRRPTEYGGRRRGIFLEGLSDRHDRAEGAGLHLPRYRRAGGENRQTDGRAARAIFPSAAGTRGQPRVAAQRVAASGRSRSGR